MKRTKERKKRTNHLSHFDAWTLKRVATHKNGGNLKMLSLFLFISRRQPFSEHFYEANKKKHDNCKMDQLNIMNAHSLGQLARTHTHTQFVNQNKREIEEWERKRPQKKQRITRMVIKETRATRELFIFLYGELCDNEKPRFWNFNEKKNTEIPTHLSKLISYWHFDMK